MTGGRWDSDIMLAADAELQAHIADAVAHGGGAGKTLGTDFLVVIGGPNKATIYNWDGTQFGTTTTDIAALFETMAAQIRGYSPRTGANVVVRAVPQTVGGQPYDINLKKTIGAWRGGSLIGPNTGRSATISGHPEAAYNFIPDAAFVSSPSLPARERSLFDFSLGLTGLQNITISGFSADCKGRIENGYMILGAAVNDQIRIANLQSRGWITHGYSFGRAEAVGANMGIMAYNLSAGNSTSNKISNIDSISMAGSGLVTVNTHVNHGLHVGDNVTVWDVEEAGRPAPPGAGAVFNVFNGWFMVVGVPDADTFTYQCGDGSLGAHTGSAGTGAVWTNRACLAVYNGDTQINGPLQFDTPGDHAVGLYVATRSNLCHVGPGMHVGSGPTAQVMPRIVVKGGNSVRIVNAYVDGEYDDRYGGMFVEPEAGYGDVEGLMVDHLYHNINQNDINLRSGPQFCISKVKKGSLIGVDIVNPETNGDVASGGAPSIVRLVDTGSGTRIRVYGGQIGATLKPYEKLGTAVDEAIHMENAWYRPNAGVGLDGRSKIRGSHVFGGAGTFTVKPSDQLFALPTNIQVTYSSTAYRQVRVENLGGVSATSFDITVDGACTVYWVAEVTGTV